MEKYYLEGLNNVIAEQLQGIYLTDILLIFAVSALVVIVPGYILIQKNKEITWKMVLTRYFLLVYIGIVFLITIFRRGFGAKERKAVLTIWFGGLRGGSYSFHQLVYCALNVLLFVPFGFLVRFIRKNDSVIKGLVMTTLLSFLFTFVIENIQLSTRAGYFEMTDVVTNIFGGAVGAILGTIVLAVTKGKNNVEKN